jgi:hypothetical protein
MFMAILFGLIFGSILFTRWALPNEPSIDYHHKCYDKYGSVINDLECTQESIYLPLIQKVILSITIILAYVAVLYQTYCEGGL